MINNVVLVGRLTKEIELKKTQSGISTVQFTVACDRRFKNEQGEKQADFINCVAWRQSAEYLSNYAKKGDRVGVTGRIQTRSYNDNQGNKRYVTEVVAENVEIYSSNSTNKAGSETKPIEDEIVIMEDELPF